MSTSLLGNSAVPQYVKIMAAGMLAATYVGALVVEGASLLNHVDPPAIATFVLGTGVSVAVQVLGIHTGASLGEAVPPNVTVNGGPNASAPTA